MINTILFDLDGTILDTHELIFETFKQTFMALAPHLDTDSIDYQTFIGPPIDIMFSKYLDDDQIDDAIAYFRKTNIALHETYVTLYPNIELVLKALKAKGYNIAIVSNKIQSSIRYGLELFGLSDYFDYIVGFDDVSTPKPHPQGIQMCLEHYNIDAAQAIMVGDAIGDIKAAKSANCLSAMVTYSLHSKEEIQAAKADVYLDDMKDLLTYLGGFENE